ncbi:hypothetical protein CC2G_001974 [Coprinopsis cinerea AmutBmut pab1-1]|nr:hypothetical protein CC2G_001974 [Coprinopsis cinerea AmutBmut pab1-1]
MANIQYLGIPNDVHDNRVYELIMRQEPKQARMCGVGGKADRRPIDPPPIVQLRVIDPAANERRRRNEANGSPAPNADDDSLDNSYAQSFLQNPYYFMFASLAKPDDDAELHWLKDGRTRCTTGSVVSSLYHLKDPQNNNEDAGFFVFPDLSVRTEGSYRLKLSLFEVVGNNVRHCKSIYSAPFYVYTAKKFPGMEESTPLSCSLADQGIKIRIRKDIRVRKRPNQGYDLPLPLPMDEQQDDEEDDQIIRREPKRTRTDDGSLDNARTNGTVSSALAPLGQQPQQPQQQSWPPPTGQDPALGPSIPPPPNATMSSTLTVGDVPGSGTMNMTSSPSIPGPPATYDSRAPAQYPPYDQTSQPMQQTQPQQPYRDPNQPSAAPQQPPPQHMPPPPPAVQHQPQPQPPQQPQPQQQVYQQPPAQHMPPPPGHVHAQPPPPPHGHMAPAPPPPPQGYAPYPQTWGAPPPPQQPVYDGYYHHQQHAPPVPQHHYAAHPNAYAQPPPPPAHVTPRYDYYQQQHPPMPAQYGYYDQSGQMHHQQLPPQQQQPAPHTFSRRQ